MLLKASGCIAISGGLEVASDRLLALMKKGVTVSQVARICRNFTDAGIMVHAYLMYGFPTQTARETIDALEMVRQLFENGVVQSGFWHQFAMTAHSPVGLDPAAYQVVEIGPGLGKFANNDLYHDDPGGADHELFSEGLKKSLFNYMHGICFEFHHQEWFDFPVPETSIPDDFILEAIGEEPAPIARPHSKMVWLGGTASLAYFKKRRKGKSVTFVEMVFQSKKTAWSLQVPEAQGEWLAGLLPQLSPDYVTPYTFRKMEEDYAAHGLGDFADFCQRETWQLLRENGLLVL